VTVRSGWHYNSPAQSPGQTRADTRAVPLGTFTPTDATQTRPGVVPGGTGLNLTGTGMTGTISVGRAVVQGTSTQGAYPWAVTVAESFTVANGHASLARIDSVFAVIYDQLYDASGNTLAALVYVQGTASGSPVAPTAPTTSTAYLKLWDIAVPAGASAGSPINWGSALTDRRQTTVAIGGINPGGTSVAGAYPGQFRDGGGATGILERYNGSTWEPRVYLGNSGQLVLGDVNFYRSAANVARTDDAFVATSFTATSMASSQVSDATARIVNSGAFIDGPFVLSTTVVVPPSGKVDVGGAVTQFNPAAQFCYSDLAVTGSVSGVIRAAADATAVRMVNFNSAGANELSQYLGFIVTSANPGETITVKWQHRTTGASAGQFSSRSIKAAPLVG
jgi:hypothetical protein